MKIKPLRNNIIFQFLNNREHSKGMFKEKTSFGLEIISNPDDTSKKARWGQVKAIGDSVNDVNVNDYILIEPLMWTEAVPYNNQDIWKTDESKVLAISDDIPSIYF